MSKSRRGKQLVFRIRELSNENFDAIKNVEWSRSRSPVNEVAATISHVIHSCEAMTEGAVRLGGGGELILPGAITVSHPFTAH